MKEILINAIYCSVPISLFAIAAWLIYKQAVGWGWFLFCVVLVVGSLDMSYTPDKVSKEEKPHVAPKQNETS